MRLLIFFIIVVICKQGDGTTYECDTTASCGCSASSTILTRIVGGEKAAQGSWSWAVSLRNYGSHFCGGSILSPSFIVTAAHCVEDITSAAPLSILAGSTTITPSSLNSFYQIRSIAQIYKHSEYNAALMTNDIALLRLSTPLDMTSGKIKSICLPNGTVAQPPDNINMIAVGWGVTASSSNAVSPRSSSSHGTIHFDRFQFCAGLLNGGKDTCQGDSGGPLMAFINGLWQLHGLTSYGYGCAQAGYPGIYTRVSAYVSWIKSITAPYEITTIITTKKPTTTTTTTKKPVTTTPTKKPTTTTTTTKKGSLTTTASRKTTSRKSSLDLPSEMTSNETDHSVIQNLMEESVLQTSNSAQLSTIQSLFIICFLPIITNVYSFILLFLL